MRSVPIVAALVIVTFAQAAAQQKPRPASPAGTAAGSSAQELASGWSALAARRAAEAEAIADRLLQAGSRRHDALSLKISARVQGGRPDAALDDYEQWLKVSPHEDVFLLQPIARGLLEAQVLATDVGVRVDALQALADAGDKTAGTRLLALATGENSPGIADQALAGIGNPEAIAKLTRLVGASSSRVDATGAIEALVKAGATGAETAIAAALDPARPMPTKLAAARALGAMHAVGAIPQLRRALQDPEPPVRMAAAVALARLGDQGGADQIREMENSPVTDIRLMAASASAAGNPSGAWVSTATGALQDADPLVRLSAAQLLLINGADPAAALAALHNALSDQNPALRLAATRAMDQVPRAVIGTDVAALRRLLRDADPRVRIVAATAVLKLAGGVE
jgi:HEAT repeat protein